jgi:hypothetical protein
MSASQCNDSGESLSQGFHEVKDVMKSGVSLSYGYQIKKRVSACLGVAGVCVSSRYLGGGVAVSWGYP